MLNSKVRRFIIAKDYSLLDSILNDRYSSDILYTLPFLDKENIDRILLHFRNNDINTLVNKLHSINFLNFKIMLELLKESCYYYGPVKNINEDKDKLKILFDESPMVYNNKVNVTRYVYEDEELRYKLSGLVIIDAHDLFPKLLFTRNKCFYYNCKLKDLEYSDVVKDVTTYLPYECLEDLIVNKKIMPKKSDIEGIFRIKDLPDMFIENQEYTISKTYVKYMSRRRYPVGYLNDPLIGCDNLKPIDSLCFYDKADISLTRLDNVSSSELEKKLLLLIRMGIRLTDDIIIRFIREFEYVPDPELFGYDITEEMENMFSEYNVYPKNYKKKGISMKEFIQKKTQDQILKKLKVMKNANEEFNQHLFDELCGRPFKKCILFCLENFNVELTKDIYYGGRKGDVINKEVYIPYINILLNKIKNKKD